MEKLPTLRSRVTQFYMDVHGKRQPHVVTVDLNLTYCRKYVDVGSRLDPIKLAEVVPLIMADLQKAIKEKFQLVDVQQSVEGKNRVVFFELEGSKHIAVKIYPNKIRMEGFSQKESELSALRQFLNDFKIDMNYGSNINHINEILSGTRTKAKIAQLNLTNHTPDERFIPALMDIYEPGNEKMLRYKAFKAMTNFSFTNAPIDLQQATHDTYRKIRELAEAYIQGNRYLPRDEEGFPRSQYTALDKDRIIGSMLGLAVADMIGWPVEFLSREDIAKYYRGKIQGPVISANHRIDLGQYSDDTELTLMVAESIDHEKGFRPVLFAGYLAEHAYEIDTSHISDHGFGPATMKAARRLYQGIDWKEAGLDYSTCGPAIRVLPLAIYYQSDPELLEKVIVESSRITHNNRTAFAGAVAVGLMVARLLAHSGLFQGSSLVEWLNTRVGEYDPALAAKLKLAAALAEDPKVSDEEAYSKLGNSSESRDTVPMAFYAFLKTPHDYRSTVLTAANAGGDADSIASIAGSMSGALNGKEKIPSEWLSIMENGFLVYSAANNLADL